MRNLRSYDTVWLRQIQESTPRVSDPYAWLRLGLRDASIGLLAAFLLICGIDMFYQPAGAVATNIPSVQVIPATEEPTVLEEAPAEESDLPEDPLMETLNFQLFDVAPLTVTHHRLGR